MPETGLEVEVGGVGGRELFLLTGLIEQIEGGST